MAEQRFSLPPATLPSRAAPTLGPVRLRPLTLSDNAAAFALSECAFVGDAPPDAAEEQARQARWEGGRRHWFGWLHAQAEGRAWAAVTVGDDALVGYARVVRYPAERTEQLTELFVHPRFQGGRVGTALLDAALTRDVPDGWRRAIIADPTFPALALYHRWGVFPLATAWYGSIALGDEIEHESHENPRRMGKIDLDKMRDGRLLHFMRDALEAQVIDDARRGYGVRIGGEIGPVCGTTPEDALALVRALLTDARAAGEHEARLWVPGMNLTLLRWLRARQTRWLGQVALLASDPALVAHLDRAVLVNPPYLW